MSGRPLPIPDQDSERFWAAAADHEFILQICRRCGRRQFYPRFTCVHCHAESLSWQPAPRDGTIYTVTVVRRAPSPALADEVPYSLALVELDAGPRLMANVVGAPPGEVRIGQRGTLGFRDLAPGVAIPQFTVYVEHTATVCST